MADEGGAGCLVCSVSSPSAASGIESRPSGQAGGMRGYFAGRALFSLSPLSAPCPPEADKVREREGAAGVSPWEGEGAAEVVMDFRRGVWGWAHPLTRCLRTDLSLEGRGDFSRCCLVPQIHSPMSPRDLIAGSRAERWSLSKLVWIPQSGRGMTGCVVL